MATRVRATRERMATPSSGTGRSARVRREDPLTTTDGTRRQEGVRMGSQTATAEQKLRGVAEGDVSGIAVLERMHEGVFEASRLDSETFQLVQIAALAAVDGPPVSWLLHLAAAGETDVDLDKVLGTLTAIAPIVGTPRVVAAGGNILRAVGLAEALADDSEA
jgi:alkylhydroperoxidase/carboxymuconolactone decarboxylase family protein YurZ